MSTKVKKVPAEHEIDARIAELVMGWTLIPDPGYHGLGGAMFAVTPDGTRHFMWHLLENVYSGEEPWFPSTDDAAAMQVVDKMIERGYDVRINYYRSLRSWSVRFIDAAPTPKRRTGLACKTILAEAICLAARDAMEDENE